MFESGAARQRFLRKLEQLQAPTPWAPSREEPGEILDAAGLPVLVVDHNRKIGDVTARELALWIVAAVNAAAGSPWPRRSPARGAVD